MKKYFFLVGLILVVLRTYSQTLTLNGMLEKTKCQNVSCYNHYILLNGFSFVSLDSNYSGDKTYYYHSDNFYDTVGEIIYKSQCHFMILNGRYIEYTFINYTTRQKRNFLPFLKQLKESGFEIVSEESENVETLTIKTTYKSKNYKYHKVTITIRPDIRKDNINYSTYHITVNRVKNKVKKN